VHRIDTADAEIAQQAVVERQELLALPAILPIGNDPQRCRLDKAGQPDQPEIESIARQGGATPEIAALLLHHDTLAESVASWRAKWRNRGVRSRADATAGAEPFAGAARPRLHYIRGMDFGIHLAEVASLVGDPARANIMCALLDGRALTAKELAYAASVTPQTTSGHLAKLTEGRLLTVVKQGRHRYYRLSTPLIGQMLEGIMAVAAHGPPRFRPSSKLDEPMRNARMCYDHIAGRLGVGLADAMQQRKLVVFGDEAGEITPAGARFFHDLGVDIAEVERRKRHFCRPCLDWSERRTHMGGAVGAALAARCAELGWTQRARNTRALTVTADGRRGLKEVFGLSF